MSISLEYGTRLPQNHTLDRMIKSYASVHNINLLIGHNGLRLEDTCLLRSTYARVPEDADFLVYPTKEKLTGCSDKLELFRFCQKYNIPSPWTALLSETELNLRSLEDVVVKSRHALGERVAIISPSREEIQSLRQKGSQAYVVQNRIRGNVVKSYGCLTTDFLYVSTFSDGIEPKKCPPNISKLCRFLLDKFGLAYSGFDFIIQDNTWYLIDINPTSGWKRMPFEFISQITGEVFRNLEKPFLLEKGSRGPKMQLVILAGGNGERLESVTNGLPKPLVNIAGKPILVRLLDSLNELRGSEVLNPRPALVIKKQDEKLFRQFDESADLDLIVPFYSPEADKGSKMDSLLYSMSDLFDDFLVVISGDNLFDTRQITPQVLIEVRQSLEKYPFVVVGVETDLTEKRYLLNEADEIIGVQRSSNQIPGWRAIGRLFYAIDAARFPCGGCKTFTDVLIKLTKLGCKGKAVLLPPSYYFNINTPQDLEEAQLFFQDNII